MPPPWLVLLPLRKAAAVPALLVTGAAVGAAYGTFDLSRRFTAIFVGRPRHGATPPPAWAAAGVAAAAVTAFRERFLAPAVPKPPVLPLEGVPMDIRLRNLMVLALVGSRCREEWPPHPQG
jgi:hypothetical protein